MIFKSQQLNRNRSSFFGVLITMVPPEVSTCPDGGINTLSLTENVQYLHKHPGPQCPFPAANPSLC
jgi:hypothetical protein